jgi:predicted enzyme related to lactoylglutathione lyase
VEELTPKQNIDHLQAQNIELQNKIAQLEALVKFYEEQFRLAKHRQFGASSEKTEGAEQLGLFDEAENMADPRACLKTAFDVCAADFPLHRVSKTLA